MRLVLFVLIPLLAAGCTFKPIVLTESVPNPVNKQAVTTAAIQVLQTKGYTIALANEQTGTVTTEWADATSTMESLFSQKTRKRVMVSVSPDGRSINVQFSKQEKEGRDWTNDNISKKETKLANELLQEIIQFASPNSSRSQSSP